MDLVSFAALCAQEHNHASYKQDDDYSFAKNILIIPISMHELPLIARQYPIMFMNQGMVQPIAILGTNGKQNSYIEKSGKWRDGYYIPAAIQTYPFALQKLPEKEAGILLFDTKSNKISLEQKANTSGRLFNENGEPTHLLRNIAATHSQFYEGKMQAVDFATLLLAENLLLRTELSFASHTRASQPATMLYRVNEKAYRTLPAATIDQWFRAGWIDAISLILASQNIWEHYLATMRASNAGIGAGHG